MNHALNQLQWRGQGGHYEVWYLTLRDPLSGWSFWFRYTLSAPPGDPARGQASLWAFSFPPRGEEGALELLDHYPLSALLDLSGGEEYALEIGPGYLDAKKARGEVGEGAARIAWDLTLGPGGGSFRHVSPLLYRAKVASSAVATPALKQLLRGWIEVRQRRFVIRHAFGEQGHVYGRRHAERWVWAHCHEIPGALGAVFEGVSAQVSKLGRLLPPASPILFREPGGLHWRWNGPCAMWTVQSSFALGQWLFEASKGDMRLRGSVSAPPEDFLAVEYRDPDGRSLACHHSEAADLRLELFRRRGKAWHLQKTYEAPGATAFEYGAPDPDPRCRRRLEQRAARILPARAPGAGCSAGLSGGAGDFPRSG